MRLNRALFVEVKFNTERKWEVEKRPFSKKFLRPWSATNPKSIPGFNVELIPALDIELTQVDNFKPRIKSGLYH